MLCLYSFTYTMYKMQNGIRTPYIVWHRIFGPVLTNCPVLISFFPYFLFCSCSVSVLFLFRFVCSVSVLFLFCFCPVFVPFLLCFWFQFCAYLSCSILRFHQLCTGLKKIDCLNKLREVSLYSGYVIIIVHWQRI